MPGINVSSTTQHLYGSVDFLYMFRFLYEKSPFGGGDSFVAKVETWWSVYSAIAIFLSLLFFIGFIYSKIRFGQMVEIKNQRIHDAEARWASKHKDEGPKNTRWENIQKKIKENNPESWRVAIIEADIMLDETLAGAGYAGQSLGEKLKGANSQSFTTLQDAWDAHKVRNDIAHVGGDFVLTQKNAQDTILRFERVFREFDAI